MLRTIFWASGAFFGAAMVYAVMSHELGCQNELRQNVAWMVLFCMVSILIRAYDKE